MELTSFRATSSTVVRPSRVVSETRLDDELVLFSLATQTASPLNQTGSLLWQLFDGQSTLGEIAEDLSVATGLTPSTALQQVIGFANQLRLAALVCFDDEPDHREVVPSTSLPPGQLPQPPEP